MCRTASAQRARLDARAFFLALREREGVHYPSRHQDCQRGEMMAPFLQFSAFPHSTDLFRLSRSPKFLRFGSGH